MTALFAATCAAVIRRHPWGFAGAWIFAALAPSSSVLPLPTEIAAARRMYVPLAGVMAIAVVGVYLIGRQVLARVVPDARARQRAGVVAATLVAGTVAVAFAASAYGRNLDFRSEERLWRDTVEKRPDNPRARLNYGVILYTAQRFTEAEPQLREAVRLKDSSAPAHANLGSVLCALGKVEEGVSHLERALALDPDVHAARMATWARRTGSWAGGRRRPATSRRRSMRRLTRRSCSNRLGWLLATSPEDEVRDGAKAVEVANGRSV